MDQIHHLVKKLGFHKGMLIKEIKTSFFKNDDQQFIVEELEQLASTKFDQLLGQSGTYIEEEFEEYEKKILYDYLLERGYI